MVNVYNSTYSRGRIVVQSQPAGGKSVRTPYQQKKSGVVVHICNPICEGSIELRSEASPRKKKHKTLSEK
jgi:hypothetical protein